jgi:site-specific recombinase, phage integrase family
VNLKIQAINKYLEFIKKKNLKIKSIKIQQQTFLENVISNADYMFLKRKLKNENNKE